MKKIDEFFENAKPGTMLGKIFYMSLFLLLAILILILGVWKTIFVAVMLLIGYFIGSTVDMKKKLRESGEKMNKLKNKVIVYTKEDLNKVIKQKREEKQPAEEVKEDNADKTEE